MAGSVQQFMWSLLVLASLSHADDPSGNKTQHSLNSSTPVNQPRPVQRPQSVYKLHGVEVRPPYTTQKYNGMEYPLEHRRFFKPDPHGAPNFDPSNLRRFAPYPVPGAMGVTPNIPGLPSNFDPSNLRRFGPYPVPGATVVTPNITGLPSNFDPSNLRRFGPYPVPGAMGVTPNIPGLPSNFDPSNLRRFGPYSVPGAMGVTPNIPGLPSNFDPSNLRRFRPYSVPGAMGVTPNIPGLPSNFDPSHLRRFGPYPVPGATVVTPNITGLPSNFDPLNLRRFRPYLVPGAMGITPNIPGLPSNFDPSHLRRFGPYPVPGAMGITPNLLGLPSNFNPSNPTDMPGSPIQPGFPGLLGAFGPYSHPGVSTHSSTLREPSNFNPPYQTPVSGPPEWYRGPMPFGPNLHSISSIRPNLPGHLNFHPPDPGSSMQSRYRGPTGAFGTYPPLKFLDALATIRGVPLNMNPPRLPPRYQTFRTFGPYLPELSKGFGPNLSPVATPNLPPFRPGYHPYTQSFRRIPPLELFSPTYDKLPCTTQSSQSTVVKEPTAPSISLKSLDIGPLAPPKNMKMDKINKFMQYPDVTWQAAQLDAIATPPAPGDLQALLPPFLRVKTRERHDTQDTRDTPDIQDIQDREDQPERLEDVGYMDGMETPGVRDGFGVPVYSEEYVVTVTRATSPASQDLPVMRGLRQGSTAPPSPPPLLSDSAAAYDETFLYGEGILNESKGPWLRVTDRDTVAKKFFL